LHSYCQGIVTIIIHTRNFHTSEVKENTFSKQHGHTSNSTGMFYVLHKFNILLATTPVVPNLGYMYPYAEVLYRGYLTESGGGKSSMTRLTEMLQ